MNINLKLSNMVITNTKIIDNYSKFVTHGFSLIMSTLTLDSTRIYMTDELLQNISNYQKLDTGLFTLQMSSSLTMRNHTVIENIQAQKESVLKAESQSSLFIEDNVIIRNNNALSYNGKVFWL